MCKDKNFQNINLWFMVCGSCEVLFTHYCSDHMVQDCLGDLNEAAKEADDLRATALFGCCEFDTFLEIG